MDEIAGTISEALGEGGSVVDVTMEWRTAPAELAPAPLFIGLLVMAHGVRQILLETIIRQSIT